MSEILQPLPLLAMFSIGLLGSGHCIGMCGGIATGLGFATDDNGGRLVVAYNAGRIGSYAIAGGLVATLGYWGAAFLSLGPWLRIVAGILLVLMGLYLAGWWRLVVYLEKMGAGLWRKIEPLGRSLLPVKGFCPALLLGIVWGWLPCGLVYTALAYAATSASPLEGALMMVFFGLGTTPAMVLGGLFSDSVKKVLQGKVLRQFMAIIMIGFGLWTLITSLQHVAMNAHSDHSHHGHK